MSAIITHWTDENTKDYGVQPLVAQHSLHEGDRFSDAGLASLLDRYPRDKLGIYTMGKDPENWRTFVGGDAAELSGEEIVQAVKTGRIWLNLRAVNEDFDEYAELSDAMFEEVKTCTGQATFKEDVGLLISSPNAQVFYHLDIPLVLLWQLRGVKKVWIYPNTAEFAPDENIERIVLKETEEEFDYKPEFDAHAFTVDLEPGMFASWPQWAPHRIENKDMMNVSLSVEYMTLPAILRANMLYTNGYMRRRFGANPDRQNASGPALWMKAALARALKLTNSAKEFKKDPRSHFKIDLSASDCVQFYDKPQEPAVRQLAS